jgi:DNA-binding transcriptional ArsR family regulator
VLAAQGVLRSGSLAEDRYSYSPRRKSPGFSSISKDQGCFVGGNFLPRLATVINICNSGYMDNLESIAALAALAQSTRLDTFRLLVMREPDGVPAGELARLIEVPQNTMSAHLTVLAHAGLVRESGKVGPSFTAPIWPASARSRCSCSRTAAAVVPIYARP